MIVANYLEMKTFIPTVQMKGIPDTFNDALETAQATLAEEILGATLTSLLEQRRPEDEELLQCALVFLGMSSHQLQNFSHAGLVFAD